MVVDLGPACGGVSGGLSLDAAVVTRCRRRVHLDHDPDAAARPRAEPDPALEQRRADAREHRDEVGRRLRGMVGPGWVSIPPGPSEVRRLATRAVLADGAAFQM